MRNMNTRAAVTTLVVAAALIALRIGLPSGTLPRVHAQENGREGCSLETLKGGYGLTFHGFGTEGPVPTQINAFTPVAGVGVVTFDGSGNLSLSETVSRGGLIAPLTTAGSYTVNPDCTGSLEAGRAAHLNFVIVHNVKEILAINTDQGRVAVDNLEKQ
jgi:hypothetical protein